MDGATTVPEVTENEEIAPSERPLTRVPLVLNRRSYGWITERIAGAVENRAPRWWWVAFAVTAGIASFGLFCMGYLISTGVGTWGLNHPVGWAWDITNFVFWIGIGHAGTLISAILYLLRQKWRTSINRSAEAMTLFAVICAAIFPGIHVGRVWMAWYLAPLPNNYGIWPNFRSPLMWDVFAVSTYFTVSVLFWYTGLIPDLATLRDRATSKIKKFLYGIFAVGWRGSNRSWRAPCSNCTTSSRSSTSTKWRRSFCSRARSFPMPTPWNFSWPGTAAINMSASRSGTVFSGRIGGTGGWACSFAIAFRRNSSGSAGAGAMSSSSISSVCA